jgi:hypothetical protein
MVIVVPLPGDKVGVAASLENDGSGWGGELVIGVFVGSDVAVAVLVGKRVAVGTGVFGSAVLVLVSISAIDSV